MILRLPCILISWKGYLHQTDRVKQIAYLYDTLFSVLLIIHCISPIPWDGGVCKRIKRGQHYNTLCILIEINRLKWDDRWIISDIILLFSCSIYHMTIYFWYLVSQKIIFNQIWPYHGFKYFIWILNCSGLFMLLIV